jgi:hypothetical protein
MHKFNSVMVLATEGQEDPLMSDSTILSSLLLIRTIQNKNRRVSMQTLQVQLTGLTDGAD